MTSQVLFRTDMKLKEAFQAKAKAQWVSMDFILNTFVRTYVENPDSIQTYVEEEVFDEMIRKSFETPEAKKALKSLGETIRKKWLL
jgi:hypothetical protein